MYNDCFDQAKALDGWMTWYHGRIDVMHVRNLKYGVDLAFF